MTTKLPSTLALLAALLTSAAGCALLDLNGPNTDSDYGDNGSGAGGGGGGDTVQPLLPLKVGNTWAYYVVAADGTKSVKYIIVKDPVMVGGTGLHQNDMAYPVHTTTGPMDKPLMITLQQIDGDKIVNYGQKTFNEWNQISLDESWEPNRLEIDQSRTQAGANWLESYTQISRPLGAFPVTVQQKEPWKVVGEEMVTLPDFMGTPFKAIVIQKGAPSVVAPPSTDGGTTDGGGIKSAQMAAGDAAADAGTAATMPKTYWYVRGIGKIKEEGGGEPMEYLTYFNLK